MVRGMGQEQVQVVEGRVLARLDRVDELADGIELEHGDPGQAGGGEDRCLARGRVVDGVVGARALRRPGRGRRRGRGHDTGLLLQGVDGAHGLRVGGDEGLVGAGRVIEEGPEPIGGRRWRGWRGLGVVLRRGVVDQLSVAEVGRAQPGGRLDHVEVELVGQEGEQVLRVVAGDRRPAAVGVAAGEDRGDGVGRERGDGGGVPVPGPLVGQGGQVGVQLPIDGPLLVHRHLERPFVELQEHDRTGLTGRRDVGGGDLLAVQEVRGGAGREEDPDEQDRGQTEVEQEEPSRRQPAVGDDRERPPARARGGRRPPRRSGRGASPAGGRGGPTARR